MSAPLGHEVLTDKGWKAHETKGDRGFKTFTHPKHPGHIVIYHHSKEAYRDWQHHDTNSGQIHEGNGYNSLDSHLVHYFNSSQHSEEPEEELQFGEGDYDKVLTKHGYARHHFAQEGNIEVYRHPKHNNAEVHYLGTAGWKHKQRRTGASGHSQTMINKGTSAKDLDMHLTKFHSSQHSEEPESMLSGRTHPTGNLRHPGSNKLGQTRHADAFRTLVAQHGGTHDGDRSFSIPEHHATTFMSAAKKMNLHHTRHYTLYKEGKLFKPATQHEEEQPELPTNHVTDERARELVANSPFMWRY